MTVRKLAGVVGEPAGAGQELVYGVGFPFQIGPRQMGVFANIRVDGLEVIDVENGTDLLIVDDLEAKPRVIPLLRNHEEDHPRNGRRLLMVKYPVLGGFVPLGALDAQGKPHRAAGTGFGIALAFGFPADHSEHHPYLIADRHQYLEVQQYRYDGETFEVFATERVDSGDVVPGWVVHGNALSNAIPDGEDLLLGMNAGAGSDSSGPVSRGQSSSGFARWRFDGEAWRPVSYTAVTPVEGWFEPTLVRIHDGSLLLTARGAGQEQAAAGEVETVGDEECISIWHSTDGIATWERLLRTDRVRAGTPLSINRGVDGAPYIAGNPRHEPRVLSNGWTQSSIVMRETMCFWPIDVERRELLPPVEVFNCERDLGPTPGVDWRIDHPNSCVVRLADGQWHEVMVFRICDFEEIGFGMLPAPHSGLWQAEVTCAQEAVTPWRIADKR